MVNSNSLSVCNPGNCSGNTFANSFTTGRYSSPFTSPFLFNAKIEYNFHPLSILF
jgi:hypothetical protein